MTQHYRLVRRQFLHDNVIPRQVKAYFHDTAVFRRYRHRRPYCRDDVLQTAITDGRHNI